MNAGASKTITENGKNLARALEHQQINDIKRYWHQAISTSESISQLVTTVRIKGGQSTEELSTHILYVSGQPSTGKNKTGSRTVVEVLLAGGLLINHEGILKVATPESSEQNLQQTSDSDAKGNVSSIEPAKVSDVKPQNENTTPSKTVDFSSLTKSPQIAINIQLHLPETDNAEVYEKLFKALKDNLLAD